MENRWLIVALWAGLIFSSISPVPAKGNAAFDATEQRYLDAYTLVRQAFEDKTQGRQLVAMEKFQTARDYLNEIRSQNPEWHSQTVAYLLGDCEKQIQSLEGTISNNKQASSSRRVANLTEEMLQTIQRSRRQKAGLEEESDRRSYRDLETTESPVPSLSRELQTKKSSPRNEQLVPVRKGEDFAPVRRRSSESSGSGLMEEKVEALQAGFVAQKKEAEQWRMQYSILEEKAKEEIRALSSEFAREKTQLETQITALNQSIEKLKSLEKQGTEKASTLEGDKKKQEEMILRLKTEITQNSQLVQTLKEEKAKQEEIAKGSQKKIDELERALEEAQSIRSKGEEESKVREGKIELQARQELNEEKGRLGEEFEKKSSELREEFAGKLSAEEAKGRELQKKLVVMVKEQADRDEEVKTLQSEVMGLSQKNKELIAQLESIQKSIENKDVVLRGLQESNDVRQRSVAGKEQEIAALRREIDSANAQKQELETKLKAENELRLKNEEIIRKNADSSYSEKVKQLNSEIQKLEVKMEGEIQSRKVAQDKATALEGEISKIREANKKLTDEKEYLIEQDKKFSKDRKSIEEEQAKIKERIAQLEQELSRAQFESAQAAGTVRSVIAQSEAKAAQSQSENERVVMELLESFKKEKSKWSEETAKLQSQVSGNAAAAESAQIVELKKTAALLQDEKKLLLEEKAQLQSQLKSFQSKSVNESETLRKEAEVKRLLENSEKEKKELYVEINRLTESVAQMKLEIQRLQEENSVLGKKVAAGKGPQPVEERKVSRPEPVETKAAVMPEKKVDDVIEQVRERIQEGKIPEALQILDKNLKVFPQNDKLLFYQGLLYSRINEFEKAESAYKKAIAVNPNFDKIYNNLGNMYSKQGKYGEAIENLKKAVDLNPNMSEAHNNMGIVYSNLAQYDEAIKSFIRATEINPGLVAAYYNLGQIYFMDGKLDAAQSSFRKVVALNPEHKEAQKYLAQIQAGASSREEKIQVVQESEAK